MEKRRNLRERLPKLNGGVHGGSTATGSSEEDPDGPRRRSSKCAVDFSRLDLATLRKYRRVNKLGDMTNATKEQLLPGIIQHFGSQDVDEQDILLAFAFALRKQRLSSMYVVDAPPPKRTRGGRPRNAKRKEGRGWTVRGSSKARSFQDGTMEAIHAVRARVRGRGRKGWWIHGFARLDSKDEARVTVWSGGADVDPKAWISFDVGSQGEIDPRLSCARGSGALEVTFSDPERRDRWFQEWKRFRSGDRVLEVMEDSDASAKGTGRSRGWKPVVSDGEGSEACGLRAWVLEHRSERPARHELMRRIDDWMEEFERKEKEGEESALKQAEQDQGWTVVSRKRGRRKTSDGQGVSVGAVSAAAAHSASKKIKSDSGMIHMYRFHRKEKRREELIMLRERFEADKKRIAKMKSERMAMGMQ